MKISYFEETDTLYIELNDKSSDSCELDEETIVDYDASGQVVSITFEHASKRAGIDHLSLSGIAA